MKQFDKFVGLDTHKDTIAVAMSGVNGGPTRYYGEIPNTAKAIGFLSPFGLASSSASSAAGGSVVFDAWPRIQ